MRLVRFKRAVLFAFSISFELVDCDSRQCRHFDDHDHTFEWLHRQRDAVMQQRERRYAGADLLV
jgi:hypothetical protein